MSSHPNKNQLKKTSWLLGALFFFTSLFGGWIAEDALIPLRVVEQYWTGNGLVWNPGERVQVCTSLLWQLLILPLGIFSNIPLALLLFSCSLTGLFGFLLGQYSKSPWIVALIATLWLASWATRDYMGSGLETPLVALLLLNATIQINKDPRSSRSAWAIGLLPLGRPDIALFCIPLAMINLWRGDRYNCIKLSAPLAIQSLITTWYFGSPLPNTFYAKLTAHVEPDKIIEAGLDYLELSLKSDMALGIAPLLAIAALFWNRKYQMAWSLVIATILYFAYSVKSADYMMGRFLVPTLLFALCTLATCQIPKNLVIGAIAIVFPLIWVNTKTSKAGIHIVDEKATHFGALTRDLLSSRYYNLHHFSEKGRKIYSKQTAISGCIGAQGVTIPKDATLIDDNRIASPLLSRLPATFHKSYAPGHNWTDSSPYLEYFLTGNPESIASPEIQKLCELLQAAHRDSVWGLPRIKKVVELFFFRLSKQEIFRLRYLNHTNALPGKEFTLSQTGTTLEVSSTDKIIWVGISAAAFGKFFDENYKCIETQLLENTKIAKIPDGAKTLLVLPTKATPDGTTATIWPGVSAQYENAINLVGAGMQLQPRNLNGIIQPFRTIPPSGLGLLLETGNYLIKIQPDNAAVIDNKTPQNGWIEIAHTGTMLTLLPGKQPEINEVLIIKQQESYPRDERK